MHKAVTAHAQDRLVRCSGVLVRKGRAFRMYEPYGFAVEEDDVLDLQPPLESPKLFRPDDATMRARRQASRPTPRIRRKRTGGRTESGAVARRGPRSDQLDIQRTLRSNAIAARTRSRNRVDLVPDSSLRPGMGSIPYPRQNGNPSCEASSRRRASPKANIEGWSKIPRLEPRALEHKHRHTQQRKKLYQANDVDGSASGLGTCTGSE